MRNRLFWKFFLAYVLIALPPLSSSPPWVPKWWKTAWWKPTAAAVPGSGSNRRFPDAIYISDAEALEDIYDNLKALALYQNSQIWLISTEGRIRLNTSESFDPETSESLPDSIPFDLGSGYYPSADF